MSAPKQDFLPAIQGLRGIAALSVLIVHLYDMPLLAGFMAPIWPWLGSTINMGGHGVELFFMISGFLIPASLVRHRSVAKFFYDRCLRILPVFVLLHLTLFTIGPIVGYKFFKGIDVGTYVQLFLVNLAFLPDALGLPIGQQNAWTLSYEWAFYILFAATFVAIVQQKNWMLALPLIALAVAGIWFRPIAAYFLVGLLFSAVDLPIRLGGWTGLLAGVVCGAAMYVSIEYLHPFIGLVPGVLLFGMALTQNSGIATALSAPSLQYLGKISYSLYLVHPFALFPLQMIGAKLAGRGVDLWLLSGTFAVLGFVLSIVAGAISYELCEVRFRRFLDAAFRPRLFRAPDGAGQGHLA
ncbi:MULTISPECIES: acyltransferase [unclassified Bradyrhizobium]|uniref:acyltransferase family protein n=1 Tax=unclassified Bradyrhizobium TaxID=2631580 RepID=UPI001BA5B291|nr:MULTISPECIES: acyltransferase [unclassified Bradyrhizobium]MBR1230017.1 acyltransferase [Bradyrhizobium sp. AUGA SZCCT0176]MBR1234848.1 acyltransferase [Bradyrhizobium sp. AUGA SZCCT0182]MBR1301903.1 acyltransferase [Bradyrhizobium sp. AUGA SZCCT0042]